MKKVKKGFTLVELVIVIAVIAILAAVLLPTFSNIIENAKESSRYQQARNAQKELVSAEGYLPEDTIGMMIGIDDHIYVITNDGLEVAHIRSKSRLEKLDIEGISNSKIIIYDKIETDGVKTPNGVLFTAGIAYHTTNSVDSEIVYVNFDDPEVNVADYITIDSNGVTSLKNTYTNKVAEISLPEEVTELGANAFYNCQLLTKVVINSDITAVGANAFYNCTRLNYIYLPDSVETIGASAFSNCSALTKMYIPDKVGSIMNNTFYYCSNLTQLVVGNGVTTIGSNAFYRCNNIKDITIGDGITDLTPFNFNNIKGNVEHIVLGKGITTIPNQFMQYAYYLKDIKFRGAVTSIGNNAFYYCTRMTEFEMPQTVTSIGQGALYGCYLITQIEIPSAITQIPSNLCYDCRALKKVKLNGTITDIGANAFSGCGELTEFVWSGNDELLTIGSNAFNNCRKLNADIVGPKVKIIKSYAFSYCLEMTSDLTITSNVEKIEDYAFRKCEKIKKLIVEDGVTDSVISSSNAFYDCKFTYVKVGNDMTLTNKFRWSEASYIELGTGFTTIGNNAFSGCRQLETLIMHSDEITSIGDYAFNYCSKLTSYTIPSTVRAIGNYAFANSGLETMTIPETVESVGNGLFNWARNLKSAVLPQSVTTIGNNMFYYCSALTRVECKGTITSIGDWAFNQCEYLTELIINGGYDSITSIGSNAFAYCKRLTVVPCSKNGAVIGSDAFNQCYAIGGKIIFADSMEEIPHWVCNEAHYIDTIVIGANVTSVANYAFDNCGRSYGDTAVKVYYKGTMQSWQEIEFDASNYGGNGSAGRLCNKPRYYYLEDAPTQEQIAALSSDRSNTDARGSGVKGYWHYNASGEIEIWP